MKQIKLTRGLFALVDDENYQTLSEIKWHAFCIAGELWYANSSKLGSMHRYILGIKDSKIFVYHKNGNTLDNRLENLEAITRSTSRIRAKKQIRETSKIKFKGVTYYKSNKKYVAKLRHTYLGSFNTEIEAAKAWNEAALKFYGKDAQLNDV